jgi:hypothetical protein
LNPFRDTPFVLSPSTEFILSKAEGSEADGLRTDLSKERQISNRVKEAGNLLLTEKIEGAQSLKF